ncbi:hypothetical protein D3C80_1867140 [compost metagenome]
MAERDTRSWLFTILPAVRTDFSAPLLERGQLRERVGCERSFTIESRPPLCRMQFGHELEGDENRTTITHWVHFTGPLAFLFRQLLE